MSFSSETKITLTEELPEKECCRRAMLAGLLLFSPSGDTPDGEEITIFKTEIPEIASCFSRLLAEVSERHLSPNKLRTSYRFTLPRAEAAHLPMPEGGGIRTLLSCEKCGAAFFRGAFLASGFVNPPEAAGRIELSTPDADLACDAAATLTSHFRLPKLSVRRGSQILYYRDAESIEYFLSYIGANKAAFAVINAQMLREKRNEINRKANFEIANLTKTVSAASLYLDAIRALMESGDFEKLSPELRGTARLRLENDTMTLAELGALETPPISKSQVSKRLQKIYEFYKSRAGGAEKPKG